MKALLAAIIIYTVLILAVVHADKPDRHDLIKGTNIPRMSVTR